MESPRNKNVIKQITKGSAIIRDKLYITRINWEEIQIGLGKDEQTNRLP